MVSGFLVSWFHGFTVSGFHPNRYRYRYRDRLFNHETLSWVSRFQGFWFLVSGFHPNRYRYRYRYRNRLFNHCLTVSQPHSLTSLTAFEIAGSARISIRQPRDGDANLGPICAICVICGSASPAFVPAPRVVGFGTAAYCGRIASTFPHASRRKSAMPSSPSVNRVDRNASTATLAMSGPQIIWPRHSTLALLIARHIFAA